MALAPWNSVLAPPRSLIASPQPLPFFSLSLPVSSSTCFLLAAKRTDVAMGTSFSFIASAFSSSSSSSSSNLSTAGFDETAVDALGNVQVLTSSTGKPAFLKDLWDQKEGIAVVALLRHFGCICCWELASELKELIPRFDAAGVKLIAIGVGSPDNARILAQRDSSRVPFLSPGQQYELHNYLEQPSEVSPIDGTTRERCGALWTAFTAAGTATWTRGRPWTAPNTGLPGFGLLLVLLDTLDSNLQLSWVPLSKGTCWNTKWTTGDGRRPKEEEGLCRRVRGSAGGGGGRGLVGPVGIGGENSAAKGRGKKEKKKIGIKSSHKEGCWLPFPLDYLYADPDRKAYDVLGLYHGLGRTFFNPASTKVFSRFSSIRKAAANYTISATPDDKSSVLQQGGMLVFKGKELLYARKDEGTGDHAPLEEVLNICCKVPVA
ncbi:Thioredoxin-like protein AAED1, chloroplastic [Dendrobium catenatum]|uniref:Thioredoxin-like protein AAED1, chloroplastic n=1 Tax=Dendrobium catenatum TaxID=906689 RepID=A0A2I0WYS9_9ASPA|nr:Thioredoxin-like protein AAED1, chloroplastic [Dendrobium catenatum]